MQNNKEVLNNMLNVVPDSYDKSEGSFIYDALAPAAEKVADIDDKIHVLEGKFKLSNLKGQELTQRVKDLTGIDRKAATKAIGTVTVTGNGLINIGDLFETEAGIQFRATEEKSIVNTGLVNMEAVIAGVSGNVPANTITLMPITITGITAVTNVNPTQGGFPEESDAELIERAYERLRTPATSGNKHHYKNWAKEVPGVGDAKVFPLWDGENTVKVTIINADREPASLELVETVQDYIDPNIEGIGAGQAPIGAYCTVVSATARTINVEFEVILEPGYTVEMIEPLVEASLTNYLRAIAFKGDIVSYALIGANLINTDGILDYINLIVNNGTANILLNQEETPVLGTVVINE